MVFALLPAPGHRPYFSGLPVPGLHHPPGEEDFPASSRSDAMISSCYFCRLPSFAGLNKAPCCAGKGHVHPTSTASPRCPPAPCLHPSWGVLEPRPMCRQPSPSARGARPGWEPARDAAHVAAEPQGFCCSHRKHRLPAQHDRKRRSEMTPGRARSPAGGAAAPASSFPHCLVIIIRI